MLNSVILLPLTTVMLPTSVRPDIIETLVVESGLKALSWGCAGVMAIAVAAMLFTMAS